MTAAKSDKHSTVGPEGRRKRRGASSVFESGRGPKSLGHIPSRSSYGPEPRFRIALARQWKVMSLFVRARRKGQ